MQKDSINKKEHMTYKNQDNYGAGGRTTPET